ncbi:hypothetical protein BD408DRAFT_366707 [Parasitella parasitica]|nr:hypothetical protein BD408DRAFT_366707 [Parasitella parasitica]
MGYDKKAFNRVKGEEKPSIRKEMFEQDAIIDEEAIKEDAERMDLLMRNLIRGVEEEGKNDEIDDMDVKQEEQFSFRLFASEPVATVTIADGIDNTDDLSKAIADQQVYEFDETDPDFVAKVKQVAIDYSTIIRQSKIPYPTTAFPLRILHLSSSQDQAAKKKKMAKKRKSKKCRDFEKAVKEGRIKSEPKMRNPATLDGWPGWPGTLTRTAIVNYQPSNQKRDSARRDGSRDGFRGRSGSRGSVGRGRGRTF